MDEPTRERLKSLVAEDVKRNRPDYTMEQVELIVSHLFTLPQLQDEQSVITFIDEYRKAVAKGVGSGLQ